MEKNAAEISQLFYYMQNHPDIQLIGYLQYTRSNESGYFTGGEENDEESI